MQGIIYKFLYFVFATVWGYKVMGGEDYMPKLLGGWGEGNYKLALENMDYHPPTKGFKDYCIITMGYHIGSLIMHFTSPRKSDFIDMTLHHMLALYLYGGCYLCNVWKCGGVIMLLHDIADVTGNFVKGAGESKYKNFAGVTFVLHMIVWAYTRMFVLPILIYQIYKYADPLGDSPLVNPKHIFCYLLTCMVLLHTFWFKIFCSMIYKFASEGVAEDTQSIQNKKTTKVE